MNETIGGFEFVTPQQELIMRNMQRLHEIYRESPSPTAHSRTRLGRHPQESRSKYNGDGSLK
jgi:hypothetical protein